MEGKRILILGGGVGGLSAAYHLRAALPPEHQIVVIGKDSNFYLCPLNMRLISGEMKHPREAERDLSNLKTKGIQWIHGEVLEINQEKKVVHTTAGTLEGDYIIIALGVERVPDAIAGFSQAAYNFYDRYGAFELKQRLDEFNGGRIVILICSTTFSCLATPFEAAFLIDSLFRKKAIRQNVEIAIYTPETQPVPLAGASMGKPICDLLTARGIEYHPLTQIERIEPDAHRLVFKETEVPFDLLAAVPIHMAPPVVQKAGLTDETGWIPVNLQTLETKYTDVFAIGDVTSVQQPNPTGFFLPKNWVIAEEQGRVVAKNIAAQILGGGERSTFKGKSFCYLGVGGGYDGAEEFEAMYSLANFYGYPEPIVYMEFPSKQFFKEREALERELVEKLI